jgi:hypothetical protein
MSGDGTEHAKEQIREEIDSINATVGTYEDGKRDGLREALLILKRSAEPDTSHDGGSR